MPMTRSPLAAVALASVKLAGYAGYARALNRSSDEVGAAKTGLGFLGGITYLFCVFPIIVPGMTMPVC
jgi:hypothetical protein